MNRALAAALAVFVFTLAPPARGLSRTLRAVIAGLEVAQPRMTKATRKHYAEIIRKEAIDHSFDPLTLIAIVHFESGFNPGLIHANPPREYSVGLSQINVLAMHRSCREDLSSDACGARIAALMDGAYNLKVAAALITANREHCRRRTGKPALFARWLSAFQGYDRRPGVTCNQRRDRRGRWRDLPVPSQTARVIRYRRSLLRALRRRGLA